MKNKNLNFILCLFLGYFGAHKFYEGKIGMGILYLCTFGLCGIGWIIDSVTTAKAAFSSSKPTPTTTVTSKHIPTKQTAREMGTVQAKKNNILCTRYSVKGKNPATGRMKTVHIFVEAGASQEDIQLKSGLLPPYEITSNSKDDDTPSEAQIRYASQLGFAFPRDAGADDASIFLTRAENGEPLVQPPMPDDLVRYLIAKGIYVPAYAGISEANRLYLYGCPPLERYAFFCMRVYADLINRTFLHLEDVPTQIRSVFDKFAEAAEKNQDFIRSFQHYEPNDLPISSCQRVKKLKAFDIARNFLKDNGLVENQKMVYVSPNGNAYHSGIGSGSCNYEFGDAVLVTEAQAIASGRTRCKRCEWDAFDREARNVKE